jgi:Rrf2 family protein
MFELAIHYPSDQVIVLSEIALAQDIPVRFLELIIAKLRKDGFVRSTRGQSGGYLIAKPPAQISIGEIFRCMEGTGVEINVNSQEITAISERSDAFIFKSLWQEARHAIAQVFDTKTLQDLIEKRKKIMSGFDYSI